MNYTYTDPTASAKDAVRFELGDTAAPWKFSDEEIVYVAGGCVSLFSTCADLLDILATKYAGMADSATVEDVSQTTANTADRLHKAAAVYRAKDADGARGAGLVGWGLADDCYVDRGPYAWVDQFNNTEASRPARWHQRSLLGGLTQVLDS